MAKAKAPDYTFWKLGHDIKGRLNLYYKGEAVAYMLKKNDTPGFAIDGDSLNGFILDACALRQATLTK